ncbi:RAMP superfamily CRISPR-associated protein [Solwaraspora sp. WMMD937]|uniref:RAMP superfamily CRISPR-associated protein n=1 Tax=Solwaraspora sp. WMMD937 TaxID=3016090 RepID=UPI00249B01B0|nr:RAMP superfamily CRISPR-associated protein [Solwaraspora sp. WMMD937]WFE21041.1 RAMP superfamily CRISPR-associated protein [Solwaraspora sp. WMMD937]
MSRRVTSRWELTGTLVAQAPLHIGGLDVGPAQLVQARDGADRPLLPGTTLAGVIRSALQAEGVPDYQLWGLPPDRDGAGGEASWVRVDDAPAIDEPQVELRDHVSIDRVHGVAAKGHLFSREVLPAGTRFAFRMVVDAPESIDADEAEQLVHAIAARLRGPGISVGAAVTRGLGLVRLADAELQESMLATRAGMIAALRSGGKPADLPDADPDEVPAGVLRVVVPWRPHGPLAVQVSSDGDVVSAFPLTGRDGAGGHRLELPGSSIKGVLRSHAERITRTVTGAEVREKFLAQMRADGLGPVAALFGTAAARDSGDRDLPAGRRGALQVATCVSATALPAAQWDAVRLLQQRLSETADHSGQDRGEDGVEGGTGGDDPAPPKVSDQRAALSRLQLAVDDLNEAVDGIRFTIAHHVAVDRWTGGAADALLFATVEAHTTGPDAWQPIILDLAVDQLDQDPTTAGPGADDDRRAALALLLLVLRDLCDGWLGFGHGTTRGAGGVRVDPEAVTFRAGHRTGWFHALGNRSLADVLADEELTASLTTAWLTATTGGAA